MHVRGMCVRVCERYVCACVHVCVYVRGLCMLYVRTCKDACVRVCVHVCERGCVHVCVSVGAATMWIYR